MTIGDALSRVNTIRVEMGRSSEEALPQVFRTVADELAQATGASITVGPVSDPTRPEPGVFQPQPETSMRVKIKLREKPRNSTLLGRHLFILEHPRLWICGGKAIRKPLPGGPTRAYPGTAATIFSR